MVVCVCVWVGVGGGGGRGVVRQDWRPGSKPAMIRGGGPGRGGGRVGGDRPCPAVSSVRSAGGRAAALLLPRSRAHPTSAAAVQRAILAALFFSSVASTAPRWFSSFCRQSTPDHCGEGGKGGRPSGCHSTHRARGGWTARHVDRRAKRPSQGRAAPPPAERTLGSNSLSACTAMSCVASPTRSAASTWGREGVFQNLNYSNN